jgi:aminoglycoside 6'-N-acetyltransferase I
VSRLIRVATTADNPVWLAMRRSLWPDEAGLAEELEALLERDNFQVWLAFEDAEAAGFVEASVRAFANGCDSQPVAFLEGIWVADAHRRRGLGRALVRTVEAWAKSQGLFELGSDTWLDDRRSQEVHGHWGFEETERVVYFRKKLPCDGDDEP